MWSCTQDRQGWLGIAPAAFVSCRNQSHVTEAAVEQAKPYSWSHTEHPAAMSVRAQRTNSLHSSQQGILFQATRVGSFNPLCSDFLLVWVLACLDHPAQLPPLRSCPWGLNKEDGRCFVPLSTSVPRVSCREKADEWVAILKTFGAILI